MREEELESAKRYLAVYRRQHGGVEEKYQPKEDAQKKHSFTLEYHYGQVRKDILSAIDRCPDKYTVTDIEAVLATDNKSPGKTAISQWMTRLTDSGAVYRIADGSGRTPAIYSKTKPSAASLSKAQ